MRTIKFKHDYIKLADQTYARLLWCDVISGGGITKDCLNHDAKFRNGRGKIELDLDWLDKGLVYLRLVFIGDQGVPFTTFRKDNRENRDRFENCEGMWYRIAIENVVRRDDVVQEVGK